MNHSLLSASLFALGLCLAPLAQACAPGETELCMGGCICVSDPNGVLAPAQEQAGAMAAEALQRWLLDSRARVVRNGTQPMPAQIYQQLLGFYPIELLRNVRYAVGDTDQLSAGYSMLQNPDVKAVTLVDVIVFRSAELAESDAALWGHELFHVQQYRDWGTAEFARRYSRDYESVEAPAYRRQAEISRALRPTTP